MTTDLANPPIRTQRSDELSEIIRAYNQVTQKLERSHEALMAQVERLQRELASTDAQLQRSKRLAALGEMAAGIAHEIRNPLAAIGLYARVLREDLSNLTVQPDGRTAPAPSACDAAGSAQTAHKIEEAVRGLNAIVNDVLSFARDLNPRPVMLDAAGLFDRAVEANKPAIAAAQVHVERHVENDLTLVGDGELLHQALVNLIRNAVQAMADHPADRPAKLTLEARRTGAQVVLTISDTGPGISEADIDRIFNPFFTTRSTGTGLGLAIVHRIVDVHGGAISVRNDPDASRGAVFELNLPADGVSA